MADEFLGCGIASNRYRTHETLVARSQTRS